MSSIRKRNCPECGGEMKPQLINMVYRKELSDLHIEIIRYSGKCMSKLPVQNHSR